MTTTGSLKSRLLLRCSPSTFGCGLCIPNKTKTVKFLSLHPQKSSPSQSPFLSTFTSSLHPRCHRTHARTFLFLIPHPSSFIPPSPDDLFLFSLSPHRTSSPALPSQTCFFGPAIAPIRPPHNSTAQQQTTTTTTTSSPHHHLPSPTTNTTFISLQSPRILVNSIPNGFRRVTNQRQPHRRCWPCR